VLKKVMVKPNNW